MKIIHIKRRSFWFGLNENHSYQKTLLSAEAPVQISTCQAHIYIGWHLILALTANIYEKGSTKDLLLHFSFSNVLKDLNTLFLCIWDWKYRYRYIKIHINIDDQYKNPNMNNKDHLVGRLPSKHLKAEMLQMHLMHSQVSLRTLHSTYTPNMGIMHRMRPQVSTAEKLKCPVC